MVHHDTINRTLPPTPLVDVRVVFMRSRVLSRARVTRRLYEVTCFITYLPSHGEMVAEKM